MVVGIGMIGGVTAIAWVLVVLLGLAGILRAVSEDPPPSPRAWAALAAVIAGSFFGPLGLALVPAGLVLALVERNKVRQHQAPESATPLLRTAVRAGIIWLVAATLLLLLALLVAVAQATRSEVMTTWTPEETACPALLA